MQTVRAETVVRPNGHGTMVVSLVLRANARFPYLVKTERGSMRHTTETAALASFNETVRTFASATSYINR